MAVDAGGARGGWTQVLYRSAVAAALGVLGSAVALDAFSVTADTQFVFARGAYALIGLGLLAMVVAVVLLVAAIALRPTGSPQRRRGVIHLVIVDVTMVWFALWWFRRRNSPLGPVSPAIIAVSLVVVLVAAASHLWEAQPAPGGGDEADAAHQD